MRLIDADKLIDVIESRINDYGRDCNTGAQKIADLYQYEIKKMVDKQPTAYDIDKVVKQLEEERELSYADFDRYVEELSPCLDAEYNDFFHRGLERAIRIVKGGGVDAGSI